MRHVRLGRTRLPVSQLCLGTMTFGLQCDEEQLDDALAAVDKGLDSGLKARLDDLTREYRWGDDIR